MDSIHQNDSNFSHWQIGLFVGLVAVFLIIMGQATTPYIQHDDWDWLINWGEISGYATPWYKSLSEGRWIGAIWHPVVRNFSPEAAYAAFIAFYLLFCVGFVRLIAARFSLLGGVAVFFSSAVATWSFWPATSIPAVALLAAAVWLLVYAQTERQRLVIIFLAVYFGVMAYPSVGPTVLIAYAAAFGYKSLRAVAVTAGVYVCGFASGVLTIHTLNLIFHGIFGVVTVGWRQPTPAHDFASLLANLPKAVSVWREVVDYAFWPSIVGLITLALLVIVGGKRRVLFVVAAVAFVSSMDFSMSMVLGMNVPYRSYLWYWPAMCIPPMVLALDSRTSVKLIGTAGLLVIAVAGLKFWHDTLNVYVRSAKAEVALGYELSRAMGRNGSDEAVSYGYSRRTREFAGYNGELQLQLALWKRHGIRLRECAPEICTQIEQQRIEHLGALQGRTVVRFQ